MASDYWSNRTGPCSAALLSVQSNHRYENILQIGEVLGHRIDAEISPKPASEKEQTTVSKNRYTSPKIDVFRTAILTLLAPRGNNVRASFLVYQVPRTSATVLLYHWIFTQFSLRVWASEYTCRPMIANLLYNRETEVGKYLKSTGVKKQKKVGVEKYEFKGLKTS